MSDTATTLSNISSVFPSKSDTCVLRTLLYLSAGIIILSVLSSLAPRPCNCNDTMTTQHQVRCGAEEFQDVELSEFKPVFIPSYKSIPLTAPNAPDGKGPANLLNGQASRRVTDKATIFDINANLYVLNGNIFQTEKPEQSYQVHLVKGSEHKVIGNLQKDGDGIYKLKVGVTVDINGFDELQIVYVKDKSMQLLLEGQF